MANVLRRVRTAPIELYFGWSVVHFVAIDTAPSCASSEIVGFHALVLSVCYHAVVKKIARIKFVVSYVGGE